MELREPKKKRVGSHIKLKQPFPILIESENESFFGDDIWPLFIGNFTGDCVVVCNPEEMVSLSTMGFFGKGSFSRGHPSFGITIKGIPPVIKERQWKRRKLWMEEIKKELDAKKLEGQEKEEEKCNESEKDNTHSANEADQNISASIEVTPMEIEENESELSTPTITNDKCLNTSDLPSDNVGKEVIDQLKHSLNRYSETTEADVNCKVLVVADSDEEDLEKVISNPQPHLEEETMKTVVEVLNLTLEEAFFLSYALGCLHVIDMTGNPMTLKHMWITFCEMNSEFIESYVAYHYFRAKGWVVKTGHKFGGDFLLYKQGPPFYHASYIVFVERVNNQLEKVKNSLSWTKFHGLNRLAENSGKDIITCQVLIPDSLTSEDLSSPKCLHKCQVNEVLTRRWISSQEREEKES